MRSTLLTLLCASAAITGCRCSPPNPQPVTLRVINTTKSPIYVDGSGGKLGLSVERDVNGALFKFDDLACECRYCTNACTSSCSCPDAGVAKVVRIEPGSTAERTWDGVIQTTGYSNCGTDMCLDQVNAPLNEPFTLELCFNAQKPTGVRFNDAGVGDGVIPLVSSTCTTRTFAPQDLVVEIGPARGSACTTNADCKGMNELCFDSACTTGCPANDYPTLGAEWVLLVANPDNMGFFEQGARGAVGKQFTGTGTLTSAVYQSSSLLLSFSRTGTVPGEVLTGRVQVKLPSGIGPPLTAGAMVKVLVTDDAADVPSRALSIRDATTDEPIFFADMAQGGRAFVDAETAPFSVSDGAAAAGCTQDACGRKLVFPLSFASGASQISLLPGQEDELLVAGKRYHFLNVSSGRYESTSCDVKDQRPWLFWKVTTP